VLGIVNSKPKTDDPNYTACNETNITWGVDYTGSSSKFNFYECSNKENSLSTTMVELAEYDNQTRLNSNKIVSFASQNWVWNTQEYENYTSYDNKSDKAVCNTYNSTLSFHGNDASNVPVIFEFTSCIMLEDYQYEVCPEETPGNANPPCQIISGVESSLKWSVKIGSFPFSDQSHTLKLTIQLQQTNSGANFADSTDDVKHLYTATVGNFDLVAPLSAKITNDGNTTNVNINVGCVNKGNNQINCIFTFNYYNGTLNYDPTIGGNTSNSQSITFSFSLFNSIICFLIVSLFLF